MIVVRLTRTRSGLGFGDEFGATLMTVLVGVIWTMLFYELQVGFSSTLNSLISIFSTGGSSVLRFLKSRTGLAMLYVSRDLFEMLEVEDWFPGVLIIFVGDMISWQSV